MKYKALILDLDGTLVSYQDKEDALPTKKVTEAVIRAQKKIHVSIATARPIFLVKKVFSHLKISGPCVVLNGAQIYDPKHDRVIKQSPISAKDIPRAVETVLKYKLDYVLHDGFRRVVCEDIEDTQVISIFVPIINHSDIDNVEDDLREIKSIALHRMPSWEKGFISLDITESKVSKLHAISDIFKILNIESHEAIGVGDSYNDYPLLMACGLKIAMGNAVSELKEIADFIAPSVEDDGVATVVEKFIFNS